MVFKLPVALVAWTFATLFQGAAAQVPTWPSGQDELEDMMFLNSGYRAKAFSAAVTPCSFSKNGVGRMASAEWLRTAFHDMATAGLPTGSGGLDGSINFELTSGENIGDAFNTTLQTFAPFFTSRSSLADIIALGVYTSVRTCGGPVVAVKYGRIDATFAGPLGVPQPQNQQGTFINQFARMGFTISEMVEVVACGHTIGGVHAVNFPLIVPAGTAPNDYAPFDTTAINAGASFDPKIAVEYMAGNTSDPLVVGPSVARQQNADTQVFTADSNTTIAALRDPAYFKQRCSAILQKMIETVPSSVTLSGPIVAYDVKPYALQLTLQDGGNAVAFTGDIRIRTTIKAKSTIAKMEIFYKDRTGASVTNAIAATYKDDAFGFDDSFSVGSSLLRAFL
jgi:hypothetical protein